MKEYKEQVIIEKLEKEPVNRQIDLLYEWTKTGRVNKRLFTEVVLIINKNIESDTD